MMTAGAGTAIIRCLAARFVPVMRTTTDARPVVTWSLETLRTIRIDVDQRRTVKNVSYKLNDPNYETTLELDSHADTCV